MFWNNNFHTHTWLILTTRHQNNRNPYLMGSPPLRAWLFQDLVSLLLKVAFINNPLFKLIMFKHMLFIYTSLDGFITNHQNQQLPVGLFAKLEEHCTDSAVRVYGWVINAMQGYWLNYNNVNYGTWRVCKRLFGSSVATCRLARSEISILWQNTLF